MSSEDLEQLRSSRVVRRSPVFYGWIIVAAGMLGMVMTSPGQAYLFSLFSEDILADLNLSRSLVSTLYTIASLLGSLVMPAMGRQIDVHGSRRMIVIISLFFGLACIFMGLIQNALMLGLGFIALRIFGPGGLSLVSENVINQWWQYRRGLAIGIASMLFALLGVGLMPNLVSAALPVLGWRLTYGALGAALLLIMLPAGYLFFRDRPELYGLQPDGRALTPVTEATGPLSADAEEVNWTLPEAIHSPAFWVVALGVGALAMLVTGLLFHLAAILSDNGMPVGTAATILVPVAISMAVFSLGSGYLLDRLPARVVLCSSLILLAAALFIAPYVSSLLMAIVFGLLLGTGSALMRTLSGAIWAIYFGRRHLGSIAGVARAIVIAGAALGPMPFGIARDLTGSFNPALTIAGGAALVLALSSLFIAEPRKAEES